MGFICVFYMGLDKNPVTLFGQLDVTSANLTTNRIKLSQ